MSWIDAYPLVSRGHSTHPATAASGLYASHSTPINKPAYHSHSYSTPDAYFPQADAKSTPHRNRDKDAVGGSNRQYYAGRTWHGVQQLSPTNHLSAASNYYGTSSHLLAVPPTTPQYAITQTSSPPPPPTSPVHRSSRSRSRAPQYSRAPPSPAITTSSQPSPGYHRHRTALAPTHHSPHSPRSRNIRTKDYTITHSSTRSKGLGLFASRALKPGDSIPIHQDEEADAARLNHSCSPNTRYIPSPPPPPPPLPTLLSSPSPSSQQASQPPPSSSLLIPLRPIRTNEELTVSYLPTDILLLLPHTSRRRWVWEHFGFECLCTRCVAGSSSSSGRGENKNKNKNKETEKEKEKTRSRRSRRESDEARKWLAWFLTGGVESSEESESAERSEPPPPVMSFEEWCFSASGDDDDDDDELALISLHLHALDLVEREGLEVLGKARHVEAVVMCYGALGEAWAGEFREWVWRMLLERRREGGCGMGAGMLIRDESEKAFMLWLSNPVTFPLWGLKLKAKRRPGVKPAAGCRKW